MGIVCTSFNIRNPQVHVPTQGTWSMHWSIYKAFKFVPALRASTGRGSATPLN